MLPKLAKSKTESEDPNCDIPKTDNAEPSRTKVRKDSVEPTLHQSSRERLEPNRIMPQTDREEPIRAKLRRDNEEPSCTKSKIDTEVIRLIP